MPTVIEYQAFDHSAGGIDEAVHKAIQTSKAPRRVTIGDRVNSSKQFVIDIQNAQKGGKRYEDVTAALGGDREFLDRVPGLREWLANISQQAGGKLVVKSSTSISDANSHGGPKEGSRFQINIRNEDAEVIRNIHSAGGMDPFDLTPMMQPNRPPDSSDLRAKAEEAAMSRAADFHRDVAASQRAGQNLDREFDAELARRREEGRRRQEAEAEQDRTQEAEARPVEIASNRKAVTAAESRIRELQDQISMLSTELTGATNQAAAAQRVAEEQQAQAQMLGQDRTDRGIHVLVRVAPVETEGHGVLVVHDDVRDELLPGTRGVPDSEVDVQLPREADVGGGHRHAVVPARFRSEVIRDREPVRGDVPAPGERRLEREQVLAHVDELEKDLVDDVLRAARRGHDVEQVVGFRGNADHGGSTILGGPGGRRLALTADLSARPEDREPDEQTDEGRSTAELVHPMAPGG